MDLTLSQEILKIMEDWETKDEMEKKERDRKISSYLNVTVPFSVCMLVVGINLMVHDGSIEKIALCQTSHSYTFLQLKNLFCASDVCGVFHFIFYFFLTF